MAANLIACDLSGGLGRVRRQSCPFSIGGPRAAQIAHLMLGFIGVSAVVYLVVIALLVWSLIRRRSSMGPPDAQASAAPAEARASVAIGVGIAVTVLVLLALASPTSPLQRSLGGARMTRCDDLDHRTSVVVGNRV